ncbi:hypothetical protein ACLKA6_001093 [Drosophila palustris]
MTPGRQIFLAAYAPPPPPSPASPPPPPSPASPPPPPPPSRWQRRRQRSRQLAAIKAQSTADSRQQPGPCIYPCCNKDPYNDPCSNKGSEDQRPYEDERPRQSSDYVTSEDPL